MRNNLVNTLAALSAALAAVSAYDTCLFPAFFGVGSHRAG